MDEDAAADIEHLADGVLQVLIGKREFINKIEERVLDRMYKLKINQEVVNSGSPSCSREAALKPSQMVAELARTVESAAQAFAQNVRILYKNDEVQPNRDASLLFSLRLQVERLKEKQTPERLTSCVIRLINAVKLFSNRVSSTINVPNALLFANNLADLLFDIDSAAYSMNIENFQSLNAAVRLFNDTVVPSLNKIQKEIEAEKIVKQTPKRTPQLPPKRRPLVSVQHKSPGFLMSHQLQKDRQRIAITRSSSAPQSKRMNPATPHNPAVKQSAQRIKNKWVRILDSESLLRKSVETTDSEKAARIARRITAEVVKEVQEALNENGLIIISSK